MAKKLLPRRGSESAHSTFIGDIGEITVDLTNHSVVVHDGETQGGWDLKKDLTALRGIRFLRKVPNLVQTVLGYHDDTKVGGGQFVWNPNRSWNDHDGGLVIASDSLSLYTGSPATLYRVLQYVPRVGAGCWERVGITPEDIVPLPFFGILGGYDNAATDTVCLAHLMTKVTTISKFTLANIRLYGKVLVESNRELSISGPGVWVQTPGNILLDVKRTPANIRAVTGITSTYVGVNSITTNPFMVKISKIQTDILGISADDIMMLSSNDSYVWAEAEYGAGAQVFQGALYKVYAIGFDYYVPDWSSKAWEQGARVVSNARVYSCGGVGAAVSTVQPTHLSGTQTYADGYTWGYAPQAIYSDGEVVRGETSNTVATVLSSGSNPQNPNVGTIFFATLTNAFTVGENLIAVATGAKRATVYSAPFLSTLEQFPAQTFSTALQTYSLPPTEINLTGVTIDTHTSPDELIGVSNRVTAVRLAGVVNPTIDIQIKNGYSRGVELISVWSGKVDVYVRKLPNFAQETEAAYGYGVDCSGATAHTVVTVRGGNCRHGFTTNSKPHSSYAIAYPWNFGAPHYVECRDSHLTDTLAASYDTHGGAYGTRFSQCVSIRSGSGRYLTASVGLQNRGFNTDVTDFRSDYNSFGIIDDSGTYPSTFDFTNTYSSCYLTNVSLAGIQIFGVVGATEATRLPRIVVDGGLVRGDGMLQNQPAFQYGYTVQNSANVKLTRTRVERINGNSYNSELGNIGTFDLSDFESDHTEVNAVTSAVRVYGPAKLTVFNQRVFAHKTLNSPVSFIRTSVTSPTDIVVGGEFNSTKRIPKLNNTGPGIGRLIESAGGHRVYHTSLPTIGETYVINDTIRPELSVVGTYRESVCVTAGVFSTVAISTGTSYTLGAIVHNSTTNKVYSVLVVGGGTVSTVPNHNVAAGQSQADGYTFAYLGPLAVFKGINLIQA